ncbi:MAG: hypothetical protein GC160_24805 [Acidobacteria bacterium]|nr:hypothetical protein [Acidobacteriota bacterium]
MRALVLLLCAPVLLPAQSPPESSPPAETGAAEAAGASIFEEVPEAAEEGSSRTDLNLLGVVDAESGEARRNENVQIDLIDNNVLKEMNKRIGVTATIVEEFEVQSNFFGSEFGGSPSTPAALPFSSARDVHGSLFWTHDNSIFRARSFFQVGDVQPARLNEYGFDVGVPLWKGASFTLTGQQTRNRGQVNGNVLVPKADERTPLDTVGDPLLRLEIQRMLDAYPDELPNRPDINPRALNTNAPQLINNDILNGALSQSLGEKDSLSLRYGFTTQHVEAFQLIAGQNPDSQTRNHDARLTWTRAWTPRTETDYTVAFDRVGSLLVPDQSSFGPTIMMGGPYDDLGPKSNIPIDRTVNRYRTAAALRHNRGRHNWSFGADIWRREIIGDESNSNRGQFSFGANFGNDSITNIRLGLPSTYIEVIGNTRRAFRQFEGRFYAGDDWRVNNRVSLNLGLRYEYWTKPVEANGLGQFPFGCDCNNVAPRFGFAIRAGDRWGVVRGAYGMQYAELYPTTYSSIRFNTPYSQRVRVAAPDFLDPLQGLDRTVVDPNGRGTYFAFAPDLNAPYSHQYNFSWEIPVWYGWRVNLGYVGSRTWKLITLWYSNRGRPVDGIEQITATLNDRRPDKRYFDIRTTLNGGRAYYDAGKATLIAPSRGGFTFETSYWFSKAIDLGSDYTSTAAGDDARDGRGQTEFDVFHDMKSLSNFDQPHSWVTRLTWRSPELNAQPGWLRASLRNWEIFAVALVKTGTPFTVSTGSDGPGYGNVDGSGSDRPNIDDPSILGRKVKHPDTSRARLPEDAFSFIQPTEARGSIGRNTFRKDGIQNLNAALSRTWPVAQEARLTLRAESNNLLNRPQFAEPGKLLTSPNFGQITNTLNDGRSFRFLLRLSF